MPDLSDNPYAQVIDLTAKAQRERRDERAQDLFPEPDPPLPEATIDSLPEPLQEAVERAGWTDLMKVQSRSIPYMLDERDLIVQSRTGSGKTGAFLLPLFDLIDPELRETQALILTPTRELAKQIHAEFERMRDDDPESLTLSDALVYGGVKYGPQIRALKAGAHVVIGTPGRILDHLDSGNMKLDSLRAFILDEADEMLSMGFYPAMKKVKRFLPGDRQSYMFSATMPPSVRSLGNEFLNDPGFLMLSTGNVSVDAIEHRCYIVKQQDKDRALVRLIEMENPSSAIIFANTKREVEYLAQFLQNYGHHADEISGDLAQRARERVMKRIRDGKLRFLVATDVAARGIDISDLSHVFIYDIPEDPESYVHRSGRTARAGKTGTSIALVTMEDKHKLLSISRRYGFEIEEREMPTEDDVTNRIAQRMVVVLEARMRDKSNLERERLKRFIPVVEELTREEPELLAMLIDEIYHDHMHRPPEQPSGDTTPERPERVDKSKHKGGGRGRGNRRKGKG